MSCSYSCKRANNNNKLIPAKDLVDLLTELYIADGLLAMTNINFQFSTKDSISNYLDIIQRHGYTKTRVDRTIRYYFEKKPEKLENIYDQVLTRLNEKQALLEKDIPAALPVPANLWTGLKTIAVPESGIKDSVWFSVPISDTGKYVIEFTTVIYKDDQSLNPRVALFFWHSDSTKTGFRNYWKGVDLPKDGQWHNYSLSERNTNPKVTHISGWLLACDPKTGRWDKHARIENITIRRTDPE
jgi:hypothetical protein